MYNEICHKGKLSLHLHRTKLVCTPQIYRNNSKISKFMAKKIFLVEIVANDNAEKSINAGMIMHAVIPVAEKFYFTNLEGVNVREFNEE